MKYSKNNQPIVCMMTNSTCYKGTTTFKPKGILWHSTGANNPMLKRYVQPSENDPNYNELMQLLGKNQYNNDWNHIDRSAGLNCWIGKLADGTVTTVQTMPWDYKPWGCGGGAKGSCNNTHIQFEICEDGLSDKTYFNKVYQEACEITAYLCKMYDIDPHGTFVYNGVTVPTILCHSDSYNLGLGSGHADVLHWFPKFGKDMNDVRNDVAALMGNATPVAPAPTPNKDKEVYRVRKSWADAQSQIGAYSSLENAKKACKPGYYVFDSNGTVVYPKAFEVGDIVRLVNDAVYTNGKSIPKWIVNSKVYVRKIMDNGDIVFSILKVGPVTGVAEAKYFEKTANTYKVKVMVDGLNIRKGPGIEYDIVGSIKKKGGAYTIVEESNGWGLLKSYASKKNGWISLEYTSKI